MYGCVNVCLDSENAGLGVLDRGALVQVVRVAVEPASGFMVQGEMCLFIYSSSVDSFFPLFISRFVSIRLDRSQGDWTGMAFGTLRDLRTSTAHTCEAVPSRTRNQGP